MRITKYVLVSIRTKSGGVYFNEEPRIHPQRYIVFEVIIGGDCVTFNLNNHHIFSQALQHCPHLHVRADSIYHHLYGRNRNSLLVEGDARLSISSIDYSCATFYLIIFEQIDENICVFSTLLKGSLKCQNLDLLCHT